jgi:hypothetical protein
MGWHSPRRTPRNGRTECGHEGWSGLTGSKGRWLVPALAFAIVVVGASGCGCWWSAKPRVGVPR